MRKNLLYYIVFSLFLILPIKAESQEFNIMYDGYQAVYSPSEAIWSATSMSDDGMILIKKLYEGAGSYSIYNYENGDLAFALATDFEILSDGKLIVIDNNLLKYYKMVYNGESFEQVPLTDEEIQEVFPDVEILKISSIDEDNKMWLHKPFLKNRTLLLVNDTDKYFHRINCKSKNVQHPEIRGLFTISKYGIIRFTHFGQRDGKLIFYIR